MNSEGQSPLIEPLTDREADVLALLVEGKTNQEIAEELVLSMNTVKWYNRQIYGKLGVKNREGVAERARALWLVGINESAGPQGQIYNLPNPATPLLGRERELEELESLLLDGRTRIVSIIGPGGMGKTRLAIELAQRLNGRFVDGAAFVPLAPLQSEESIVPAIAQSLRFTFQGGSQDEKTQLLNFLRRKELFLVLDNYDHLIKSASLLIEIAEAAPNLKMVVTSREKLKLRIEQLYPLQSLPLISWETVAQAEQDPAVTLFLEYGLRVRPNFELQTEDLDALHQILQLVDGMPLAIILASAWLELLTPAEITVEIQKNLEFLEATYQDLPERHHSMKAVFETSWGYLNKKQQKSLAALSIFRGGFTLEAAKKVAGAASRDLLELVGRSLLFRGENLRFEIHELLRQYAAEHLARSQLEMTAVQDRHSSYYLALLQKSEPDLKSANAEKSLQEIQDDIDNIYTAWHRAADQHHFTPLAYGLFSLEEFWARSGRFEEGSTMLGRASDSIKALTAQNSNVDPTDLLVLVRLLAYQCVIQNKVGLREQTSARGEEALAILGRPELLGREIRFEKALVLSEMGRSSFWQDRIEESQKLLKTSILLFQSMEDSWHLAHAYRTLAGTYIKLGDFEQSIKTGTKALDIFAKLNNKRWTARLKSGVGLNIGFLGNCNESERIQLESIAVFREIEDWEFEATTITQLSVTYIYCGRYEQALESAENSARKHKELGKKGRQAQSLEQLCWAATHLGQYDRVINQFPAVLELTYQVNQPMTTAMTQYAAGCAWLGLDNPERARELLQASATTLREINSLDYLILALSSLGCAAVKENNLAQAKAILLEAFTIKFEGNMTVEKSVLCATAGLFLASVGKVERAIEVYALACLHLYVANSRWFEDIIGRQIFDAANALPPEIIAAAQQRGRSLDLWQTADSLLQELSPSH
ncbi:MAG: LuxR C-terminal-related transcriptional regulator [Candidatus Promineifilaceae bacterium]